jgi:hypothetical protein
MRKTLTTAIAAACVSAGALFAADPPARTAYDFPQGVQAKELNDQEDVRSVLAQATNAALTERGFNDLLERLSSADRKRFDDTAKIDTTELDGRIAQIQKIWKEKYGKQFDFKDEKLLSSFVVIREGEITDPALAKMHWPVNVTDRSGEAVMASGTETRSYLEKGRNVAIVSIPESHGMNAMHISMLHEPVDDWRIDVPDNISRAQIYSNLKDRLTHFGENVAKWPDNVDEAYRHVSHCVLASVYNVPAQAGDSVKKTIGDAPFPVPQAR